MSSSAVENLDGRQSRTARSRLAICEACLDLVQAGVFQPSADQIAERAGLSRRSIFNHFADLAELYDAVVDVGMERCTPLLEEISKDEPVAARVEHLVRVHSAFLEATSAFTLALTAQSLVGSATDQALRVSKDALRTHHENITGLFSRELEAYAVFERAEIQEAMSAAMAPLLWETLRRSRGLSVSRARGVLGRMLLAVLRDAGIEV